MFRKLVFLASFILVLSIASNASADLVAHWKFDEGSGNIAYDSMGGNDGTLVGDPTWVAGKIGGALEFDGNGDYVDCGNTPEISPTAELSVMAWIKVNPWTKEWEAILSKGDDSYRLSRSGSGNATHFGCGGTTGNYFDGTVVVTDNQWHHVAGVYDGANMIIYIDGVEDSRKASTGSVNASNYDLFIGTNSQNTGRQITGLIDDVRLYDNALSEDQVKAAMSSEGFPYVLAPNPADGAMTTDTWASMGWRPGDFAVSHDVYFGDNFDDVNDANRDSDVFQGNQESVYFVAGFPGYVFPDGFEYGETYYWRIDEVNDADPNSPWKGPVWSFRIQPLKAYDPVPGDGAKFVDSENPTLSWAAGSGAVLHTVYFSENFDDVNDGVGGTQAALVSFTPGTLESEKTYYWRVDELATMGTYEGDVWSFKTAKVGGGIRGDYYKGMNFETFMLSRTDEEINFNWGNPGGPDPLVGDDSYSARWTGEVEAAFTETYTFYTSTDDGARLWVNGQQLVDAWVNQSTTEYRGTIDLVAGNSYSLIMEYYENTGGAVAQLSWSSPSTPKQIIPQAALATPVKANSPSPYNGATGTKMTPIIRWGAGDFAASHEVYFGTDADAVKNATTASPEYKGSKALGDEIYDPGKLAWFTTYYWRIDEVNTLNPEAPWVGNLWSFTTGDFLVIDDFEDYNAGDNQIWYLWHDGLGYGAPGTADFFAGNGTGAAVGDETTTSYTEESIVYGGSKSMPLSYDNNKSGYSNYSETELTLTAPRDWTEEGVTRLSLWFRGYPASVGSFVESPAGTYTMTASGADIEGSADEFHFAYKMLTGAGSIVARVDSVENTNNWAKAGVMIRETLEPGSLQAMTVVTPGSGVSFQRRVVTDDITSNTTTAGITAPYWVKIDRTISGSFTASHSTDGTTWETLGIPEIIGMGANVYIGLALTSHDVTQTCQAVFSNVTTSAAVSGQWTSQDIGITNNDAEPLYVAVSNAAGASAVIVHDDPSAAQIDTWTEWVIPLQAFADQGISLTDVDRIAIGLGTQGNTTPGGAGKMFIDDIRLYQPAPEPEPEPEPEP